ncbi:hypothetical protein GGI07_000037 [Coemansia sp. Benny D115]|nr:hypothetical protein GGI07_000037 [Coemansia sp. Benny D115]
MLAHEPNKTKAQDYSVKLARNVPYGPICKDDFIIGAIEKPSIEQVKDNQVLVKTMYLSCDPYLRERMAGLHENFVSKFKAGESIESIGIGMVEYSRSPGLAKGDYVLAGQFPWEGVLIFDCQQLTKLRVDSGISVMDYMGVLGMTSFSAYIGFCGLSRAKAGETILVTSAAGAVGQAVVQLAKARGLRVVGVAGSDEKVAFVKSLGADAVFSHKTCSDPLAAINKAAPDGVDIYFDNVGGEYLDAAISAMNLNGRIIACGMISQYNVLREKKYRVGNLMDVVTKRLEFIGFIVSDHYSKPIYQEFVQEVLALVKEERFKIKFDITRGLENGPQKIMDLFEGTNFGKSVIRVDEDMHSQL